MRDHLKAWMPVYIQELELQLGRERGKVPVPRSWMIAGELEQLRENQLPGILVRSPGIANLPTHNGEGGYTAAWQLDLTGLISALDQDSTRAVAKLYGAAMRGIIVQKPSVNDFAINTVWTGESYNDLPSPDGERNLTLVTVNCNMIVEDVVNRMGGPRTYPSPDPPQPATQPGSQWPEFETVEVDVELEGVNQ